ncbi:MAG: alpha-glycosidase [Lachnospiraceae bacterium]|nr:alpha-glycosidase [Lachnospiraceae bacterium]
MNQHALLHIPDSRYCFATGEKELVIRLRTAREDQNIKVFLVYGPKYQFQLEQKEMRMQVCYEDRLYQYYEKKLRLEDVRLAYIFRIEEDGESFYYSEDGLTKSYSFPEAFYNFFQMPYMNRNDRLEIVDWMRGAVFYQIFVDRFYQGNHEKDTSYIDMEWGDIPTPKSFAGGDLQGIIQKVDYLKELGVSAIYLTPVFASISNHKYDIRDYKKIDPQFGTPEDMISLVQRAHAMGIRVVMDAVFNHCSMELSEFQDVLENGRKSPYYDWFLIDGEYPEPEKMNYECFAACNYMPKLNTANEGVQEFLMDIALYWIREADIDGWRLDVSDEVSHEFWRRFRREVKKLKKDCVIIGENWHDAYPYLMGDQYDSIMNYAFTKACLDYFAKGSFDARAMAEKLNGNLMRNTEPVNYMMLNLLDSHDTHRFFTEIGRNKKRLLAGIALTVVFPGALCMYYGTEICMEGGYDPDSRRCFDWDSSHWDKAVLEKVRELLALKAHPVLKYGSVRIYEQQEMLKIERQWKDGKILLEINLTGARKRSAGYPASLSAASPGEYLDTDEYRITEYRVE